MCWRVGVTNVNSLFFFSLHFSLSLQYYFHIVLIGQNGQKPLELRTDEESECDEWVEAIGQARYTRVQQET